MASNIHTLNVQLKEIVIKNRMEGHVPKAGDEDKLGFI